MPRKKKQNQHSPLVSELRQLLGYLSQRRQRQLGLLLILMLVSSMSEVVSLGAVMPFLAALSNAEDVLGDPKLKPWLSLFQIDTTTQLVTGLAIIFIAAVIIANGLRIITINAQTHLAASISNDLSCQLYDKTLLQSYSFHVRHNSSDLINAVMGDTRALHGKILLPLLTLITNSFVIVSLIGGLVIIEPWVAIIAALVLGGAYLALYKLRRNLLYRNSQIAVSNSQQQIKVVQESLGGIRDILLGGTHGFFQSAYRATDAPFRHASASSQVVSQTPRYMIEALAMTAIGVLALGLGKDGDFSDAVPVLGGLAFGANRLLPALQRSFASLARIQGARASLHRIVRGLKRSVDPMQRWLPSVGLPLEHEICFENVWFRYGDDTDWVLQDLNLSIKARTTVGVWWVVRGAVRPRL